MAAINTTALPTAKPIRRRRRATTRWDSRRLVRDAAGSMAEPE